MFLSSYGNTSGSLREHPLVCRESSKKETVMIPYGHGYSVFIEYEVE